MYYIVPTSNTLLIYNLHYVPIKHEKNTPLHEDIMSKQRLPAAKSKNADCKHDMIILLANAKCIIPNIPKIYVHLPC